MKKALLIFVLCSLAFFSHAEEKVILRRGTKVPCISMQRLKASKADIGQSVNFRISMDINADGRVVIPAGTIARGKVYKAKRSKIFGTEGRLGIKILNIVLPSGEIVYLRNNDVYITGENKTAMSILIFLFTLLPIPGGKAVLEKGYYVEPVIAYDTPINVY